MPENLKFENGMIIVCEVISIREQRSTQKSESDYRVVGFVGTREIGFFIGGKATDRQVTTHLNLQSVQELVRCNVRFVRKMGKRTNGTTGPFLDIDLAPDAEQGIFALDGTPHQNEHVSRSAPLARSEPAAPPATKTREPIPNTAPQPRARAQGQQKGGYNLGGYVPELDGPDRSAYSDTPLPSQSMAASTPAPSRVQTSLPIATQTNATRTARPTETVTPDAATNVNASHAGADDVAQRQAAINEAQRKAIKRMKAEVQNASNLYALCFKSSQKIAALTPGLSFDVGHLHAMAATILIEAGKKIRGSNY